MQLKCYTCITSYNLFYVFSDFDIGLTKMISCDMESLEKWICICELDLKNQIKLQNVILHVAILQKLILHLYLSKKKTNGIDLLNLSVKPS